MTTTTHDDSEQGSDLTAIEDVETLREGLLAERYDKVVVKSDGSWYACTANTTPSPSAIATIEHTTFYDVDEKDVQQKLEEIAKKVRG